MLTPYDSGFGNASDNPSTQKSSSLERISQVVSIAGGIIVIVAGILSLLRGGPWYLILVLVGVAVLLIMSATYKPVEIRLRAWSERRKDRRVAREYWPKFRAFVHRFGGFVDTRPNDTLHYIIMNDVPEPVRTELNKLLVNISLWSGFSHFFMRRVDRQPPTLAELTCAVEEFHHLVAQYGNYCIAPIFERFPEQLRSTLTEQSKVKLNTFRERYGHFLTEYMAFAKQLSESRPQLQGLPSYLTYPTQL